MNKKKTMKNMKMTTRKGKDEILEERTRVWLYMYAWTFVHVVLCACGECG